MSPRTTPVSEADEMEIQLKRVQIAIIIVKKKTANEKKERSAAARERQMIEFKKAQASLAAKQRVCQHRKGGRDNRFAKGNDANYSVITNTYPCGEICITCTRCQMEVWKPDRKLKKANPELY